MVNRGKTTTEVAINIGKKVTTLSLEDAVASNPADMELIKSLVVQEMGGFTDIDSSIRDHICEALEVCKVHVTQDFDRITSRLHWMSSSASDSKRTVEVTEIPDVEEVHV